MIKVMVSGALGRMGTQVCAAVAGAEGDGLVGAAVVDVVALEEDLDALVADEVDEPVHGLL